MPAPGFCPDCKAWARGRSPSVRLRSFITVHPRRKRRMCCGKRPGAVLPLASPGEANAVSVHTTSWGARHVFPDMLAESQFDAMMDWRAELELGYFGGPA